MLHLNSSVRDSDLPSLPREVNIRSGWLSGKKIKLERFCGILCDLCEAIMTTHEQFLQGPFGSVLLLGLCACLCYLVNYLEGYVVFSKICPSVCVCVFVSMTNNSRTMRDIITKYPGHHDMVERVDMFENGYIGM